MMRIKQIALLILVTQLFISCISTEKSVKTIIKNYDNEKATRFLVDSCILFNESRSEYLSSLLAVDNNTDQIEEAIRVIPVLNVDKKAVEYDYSQNFLDYIREVKTTEWNKYIGFIFNDTTIIMEVHALKMKNKPWSSDGLAGPYPEYGDPFFQKLLKEYPDGFFFCTALKNYCVVKEGELFVCRREYNKLQSMKGYFNSYYPLEDFKEDLIRYFN